MARTITVRIDDSTYDIFKLAADGQKRTISNYLEYATLNYTMNETIVDDVEMNEILKYYVSDSCAANLFIGSVSGSWICKLWSKRNSLCSMSGNWKMFKLQWIWTLLQ